MHFFRHLLSLTLSSLFVLAASAPASVTFDNTYDNPANSLNIVACSNGANGLVGRFPTFGDIPSFPNIGGAQAIAGFNSPNCGTCWALTFNGKTVNIFAIDVALNGFNIAQEAMDILTNNQSVNVGRITANSTQVAVSACGIM